MVLPRLFRKALTLFHLAGAGDRLCLTFDDGPSAEFTPHLLELLARHQVKGTFFVNGKRVREFPEIARAIVAGGHTLANHTYSHRILTSCPTAEMISEIRDCQQVIDSYAGRGRRLFRPPRGLLGMAGILYLLCNRYRIVLWTVDSRDCFGEKADQVIGRLRSQIGRGGIVLFHDDTGTCLEILEELIPYWKGKGLRFSVV